MASDSPYREIKDIGGVVPSKLFEEPDTSASDDGGSDSPGQGRRDIGGSVPTETSIAEDGDSPSQGRRDIGGFVPTSTSIAEDGGATGMNSLHWDWALDAAGTPGATSMNKLLWDPVLEPGDDVPGLTWDPELAVMSRAADDDAPRTQIVILVTDGVPRHQQAEEPVAEVWEFG